MLNKSPELKAQRGYVEPDSFVRLDGSEVLVGEDWQRRKWELWQRCGGKCEFVPNLDFTDIAGWAICGKEADDPHHLNERWRRRDDRLSNLQALCRYHHDLLDKRKIGGRKCG